MFSDKSGGKSMKIASRRALSPFQADVLVGNSFMWGGKPALNDFIIEEIEAISIGMTAVGANLL